MSSRIVVGSDIIGQLTGGLGTEKSVAATIDAVRPGGTIVAVGNSIDPAIKMSLNKIVLHEIKLR